MKRTVLYYPTISIPDNWWLRQAVFYFDEVASIVPQNMTWEGESRGLLSPLTPELTFLQQEKIFRAISPEQLTLGRGGRGWDEAVQIGNDLRAIVATEGHRTQRSDEYVHVHRGKTNDYILGILQSEGLIKPAESTPYNEGDPFDWMLVEKNTALLYLSLLAKYLSAIDEEATVPGTDRQEYRDLVYGGIQEEEGETGVQLHLQKVLPVPKPGTDMRKIIEFTRKRKDELLRFRSGIDDLEDKLAKSQDKEEVRRNLIHFAEKQQIEVSNLSAALGDAKIETVFGSVKTLVKSNSPAFWSSLVALGGIAAAAPVIAIPAAIVGGVMAVCEVSTYLMDRRVKARSQVKQSSIAYLHYARAEGLI